MSVFDAIRALRDAIEAQSALGGESVPIGYPTLGPQKPFTVWISLPSEGSEAREVATSTLDAFNVTYDIPVRIVAICTTDDLEDAMDVAEPLMDAVVAAVSADATLAGSVESAYVSATSPAEFAQDSERGIGATVVVSCREYIGG